MSLRIAALAPLVLALSMSAISPIAAAEAADFPWPEKSGPTADGYAAMSDAAGLPLAWDEAAKKNIAWKIPLEGEGHSTPVIGYGKAWFTAATDDGKQQYIYVVDAADGKVVHHKLLFENADPEPLGNPINSYASPSCVLEEGAVYAHFGTYGTARLDPTTMAVVWQRRDLNARHYRGPGSSPIVFENLLILTFDGIDRQYVAALDKNTGKTVWETPRSHDYKDLNEQGKPKGDGDYRKAYHTPSIALVAGRPQLITVASKAAFGLDPYTGKEIWVLEHENMNAAPRVLFLPGMAIINSGSERANLFGLKLDETTQGNVTQSHVLWQRKKANCALSSPVLVGERLFFITNQGVLYSVDARSGEEIYAQRIGGSFCASPVVAGNVLYFADEKGTTTVVRAASEYEELGVNTLEEGMRASPAVACGAMYLRTFGHLYKIASPK